MQETQEMQFPPLGGEDPLEEEMTTHSSILAWRIPWTENLVGYSPWGHKESDTTEVMEQQHVARRVPHLEIFKYFFPIQLQGQLISSHHATGFEQVM